MWGQLKGIQRNYFDFPEMGLFDNMEEKSGHGNPDLQQLQCSGVVSHLLDCNVGEADYDNVEKNLYSEPNMFFMNSDTAVMNQSDWFGIDGEVPAVGVDGIEDLKRSCAASSEKVLEMKFGDSELCSTVTAKSYQLGCLGSSVESCLQKEEDSNFEEIMVNLVQNVETPMTSSLQIVPPGDRIQHKPRLDTKNNVEFSEEPVMDLQGAAEEKQDSLAGTSDGLMSQSPHKEDNSCNIDEETLTVASDGCNEVSDSLHLPPLAADSSSGRDLVIDALSGAQIIPTVLYSTRLADIEGDGNLNNCSTTALTSVRRSTRRGKASKMRETNETAAGCRKTSKNKLPRGAIIRMPLKISRKKRSCSARCGRSSVWGLLGNVMQVFEENDGTQNHDTQLIQVESDRSRKRRGSKGNQRFQMTPADKRSHLTKDKCSTANGSHVRLNFRMGGKELEEDPSVVLPQVPDPPASLPTVVSKHPTEIDSHISSDVQELDDGLLHILEKNVHDSRHLSQFTCLSEDLENQVVSPGAGVLDSQQGDKDLESSVTQDNSVGITFSDCPQLSCQRESVVLEESIQNRYSDLGTSPNSEVINSIQDVGVSSNAVLTSSQAAIDPTDAAAPDMTRMNAKRGKKHGKVKGTTYCSDGCIVVAEEKLLGHGKQSKTKKSAHKPRGKAKSSCNAVESYILETTGNASSKSSTLERWSSELLFVPENSRLEKSFEAEIIIEQCELSGEDVGLGHSELGTTDDLVKASKSKVPKWPSKSSTTSRRRTSIPDSGRSRRKNACERKEAFQKSVNDRNVKEEDVPGQIVHDEENNRETDGSIDSFSGRKMHSESQRWEESSKMNVAGHDIPDNPGKFTVTGITSEDVLKSSVIANGLADQVLPPRKAWVLCDDCDKWRCISATLADSIEATNCRWTCKDNMDKAFANCSIPQEKTNAEINAELEISDEEDAHGANVNPKRSEGSHLTVAQQAHWKPIDSNLFLHRSRKNQTIDEIMVCHCKPPQDGLLGCGDECLNRMLNIECVRGTCPCGDLCSNQQFQKRKYAKLECFRCGKKGHGLQLLEKVFEGKFLIEYVGEVLDLNAYEARQGEYAARGQRHFYFMTLNGSEVIDACAKGNLGRFINHSCDPNCRTEKWMVNGEVCIGLFAIRDIKKGEELTFDYNYVRVFGAAAKKCVCGSSECRGYIGGDPLNTETIVQSDSDEEFPEPIMVNEKVGAEVCMKKTDNFARITDGVSVQYSDTIAKLSSTHKKVELSLQKEDNIYRSNNGCQPLEASVPLEDKVDKSVSILQPIGMSSQTEVVLDGSLSSFPTSNVSDVSLQKEDTMCKNLSSSKSEFTSPMIYSVSKSSDGYAASNSKPLLSIDVDKPNSTKAHRQVKSSCSSSSIKKGKAHSHLVSANRPEVFGNKPKKVLEGADAVNNSLKGVELKLNELLDTDGGISKRKDSTKGYLKLLNFTANINGEAVQSIRDLSIILDALLKTRSRIVLVDIINKNGLQMLHNIMKQNRNNFNRTPILRKLLKVVKFLAEKEILTLEHINSGPHCHGVESFRESIFQLAKHDDIKVHQIARIFRDKWFPRTSRRGIYSDKDDVKLEIQGGINCNRQPSSYKRWHGQDPRPIEATDCSADASCAASHFDGDIQNRTSSPSANYFITNSTKSRKRKSWWDQPKEVKTNVWLPELMDDRKTKRRFQISPQHPEVFRDQISPQHPEIFREGRDVVAEANIDELCNGSDQPTEVASGVEAMLESCDCAPPGFSFPLNSTLILSDGFSNTTTNLPPQTHDTRSDWEVNMGCPQESYLSHLPVSFGIPMVFVEHLGVSQSETMDSWTVAPSIPFHSFPPLPPYPRERRKIQLPSATMSREHDEEVRKHDHCAFRCEVDPSTSGTRPPDVVSTGPSDQHMVKRTRSSSGGLGKQYFRKQKWNCQKCPPWIQRRMDGNIWQHNSRSSASNVDLVNLENEKGGFCTENVNGGGENVSSTYHPCPEHHHDH